MDGVKLILTTTLILYYSVSSDCFVRVCNYDQKTYKRTNQARFDVPDIDPHICTHLIYHSAQLQTVKKTLEAFDRYDHGEWGEKYREFTNLKSRNPSLKTLLSVGKYCADEDFLAVSKPPTTFRVFTGNVIEFLRLRNFDGLDVQWKNPKGHKVEFIDFLKGLREAFDSENSDPNKRLLLTVGVIGDYWSIVENYDNIPEMSKYPDYIFLLTYDYFGPAVGYISFSSPLYGNQEADLRFHPNLTMNWTVHHYLTNGMPASKIVVSISGLGRYGKLMEKTQYRPGNILYPTEGPVYQIFGAMAYPEVCELRKKNGTQLFYEEVAIGVYIVNEDEWVGYDDTRTLAIKMNWIKHQNLAGLMFTTIDQDDFNGSFCGEGKYPLLTKIKTMAEQLFKRTRSVSGSSGSSSSGSNSGGSNSSDLGSASSGSNGSRSSGSGPDGPDSIGSKPNSLVSRDPGNEGSRNGDSDAAGESSDGSDKDSNSDTLMWLLYGIIIVIALLAMGCPFILCKARQRKRAQPPVEASQEESPTPPNGPDEASQEELPSPPNGHSEVDSILNPEPLRTARSETSLGTGTEID